MVTSLWRTTAEAPQPPIIPDFPPGFPCAKFEHTEEIMQVLKTGDSIPAPHIEHGDHDRPGQPQVQAFTRGRRAPQHPHADAGRDPGLFCVDRRLLIPNLPLPGFHGSSQRSGRRRCSHPQHNQRAVSDGRKYAHIQQGATLAIRRHSLKLTFWSEGVPGRLHHEQAYPQPILNSLAELEGEVREAD